MKFFKKSKKTDPPTEKKKSVAKNAEKDQNRQANETNELFVEGLTPVPTIELIPTQWGRRRVLAMVRKDEMNHSAKVVGTIIFFIALAASACIGLWFWNKLSEGNLNKQRAEIASLIKQYDAAIDSASGLGGIIEYTQELPVSEQARALINICVNSGIVVHTMNMTHSTTNVPANVKNSFETASATRLDNINIHGIWMVDGSFIGQRQGNEQWILATNDAFAAMFTGTRYNTFMDISTRAVRAQDGLNRHEFVFIYWSPRPVNATEGN